MIYHFFFCGIISWTGDSMSKKNIDNIKYVLLSICTFFSFGIDINTIFNMEFDVINLTDNYSNFLYKVSDTDSCPQQHTLKNYQYLFLSYN